MEHCDIAQHGSRSPPGFLTQEPRTKARTNNRATVALVPSRPFDSIPPPPLMEHIPGGSQLARVSVRGPEYVLQRAPEAHKVWLGRHLEFGILLGQVVVAAAIHAKSSRALTFDGARQAPRLDLERRNKRKQVKKRRKEEERSIIDS